MKKGLKLRKVSSARRQWAASVGSIALMKKGLKLKVTATWHHRLIVLEVLP